MLEAPIRFVAVFAALFVLTGWGLFALDEVRSASSTTVAEIAGREAAARPDPTPSQERDRERAHGDVREVVDDVNDQLLAPVAWLGDGSSSQWVSRTVPALLALLAYGFGLSFLARYAHGRP